MNAQLWRNSSGRGTCGFTSSWTGDCDQSDHGAFKLPKGLRPRESTERCIQWCLSCSRCNFISTSHSLGDCSWFNECPKYITHVEGGFRSGRVRQPSDHAQVPSGTYYVPFAAPHRSAAVPRRSASVPFSPRLCDADTLQALPTVNVSRFHGDNVKGSGFHFEALLNALTWAASCAGVAVLPAAADGYFPEHATRTRRCLDFRHLPRLPAEAELEGSSCRPGASLASWGSSDTYYYGWPTGVCPFGCYYRPDAGADAGPDGVHQKGGVYYSPRNAAWLGAISYLDAEHSLLPCASLDVNFSETLVAHVRGGDIFHGSPHKEYGQPPLEFYLAAWNASGLPRLHVLTQDWSSPVAQALRILQRLLPGRITLQPKQPLLTDLSIGMCAPHFVVGNSMLASIFAAAPQRERLWLFTPLERSSRIASCRTQVFSACRHRYEVGCRAFVTGWKASEAQLLQLVVGRWDTGVTFQRRQPICLHLSSAAAPSHGGARGGGSQAGGGGGAHGGGGGGSPGDQLALPGTRTMPRTRGARLRRAGAPSASQQPSSASDAIMWQRGLYPTVTCPETRVVAEWHLCWPPIARAIAEHRCVAYAFGVADDDAFTNHLAAAGCTVFAFDPGADHPADWKPNVKFRHWGLTTGAASQAEERRFEGMYGATEKGEYLSLHELQRRLGHETLQITVAKVDCEGCEWELFRSIGENGGTLSQFEQVLTELHFTSTLRFTVAKAATVVPAFTRLLASSQLFPFHSAENWGNGGNGDRMSMPRQLIKAGLKPMVCCREYSFINLGIARDLQVARIASLPQRAPPHAGAKPGVCGETLARGDCLRTSRGYWETTTEGISSMDECIQRCRNCANCRYVSFSLSPAHQECSWYDSTSCDMRRLMTPPASGPDYQSFGPIWN